MRFAAPGALWWLTLWAPVLALHVLRSRRTQVAVPSIVEWEPIDRPVAAARPWQRLRWTLPLALQLLAVALAALALAGPQWSTGRSSAQDVVLIVDTSASMAATDGEPDRIADARRAARDLIADLGPSTSISVITSGAPSRIVASGEPRAVVEDRIDALTVEESGFDAEGVRALALSLDRPDRSVDFVLVGDGAIDATSVRALPAGTRFVPVGHADADASVASVVVRPRGSRTRVLATLTNTGDRDLAVTARIDVDGRTRASRSVRIPAEGRREVTVDVATGERVEVLLDVDDISALDNHAWAAGPSARTTKVAVFGGPDPYLDAALESLPDVEVTRPPAGGAAGATDADLVVFDGVDVTAAPKVPWVAIAPPAGAPGVQVEGTIDAPVLALTRSDVPLLEDLDLRELAFGTVQRIEAPAATTLLGAEGAPLLVSGRLDSVPFLYFAAPLAETNLGLLAPFPVLIERVVGELGGAALTTGTLHVGDPLPLDRAVDTVVTSPSGRRADVPAGNAAPVLDQAGFWTVRAEGIPERLVVVNLPPDELDLTPVRELPIPGIATDATERRTPTSRDVTWLAILLALAVLPLEWWTSRRRRGVARRQWRIAEGFRAAAAACLMLALVAPSLVREGDDVAVVFVVDLSDSLAGRHDEAVDLVDQALRDQPSGSLAGVVVVGATARIDRAMSEHLRFRAPRVTVDGSATNLAAGLRVAGALVPSTHARRVVLLSDGRSTVGSIDGEIARLRQAGIRLDVIPLDGTAGADLLARAVEVPPRVRRGDTIPIDVEVLATTAQTATVSLLRNDVEVDRRVVELAAGPTHVTFQQPAGEPGTVTWTAVVAGPANGQPANDRARATTRIEGRAQVVVVEGSPGRSATLVAALEASGLGVRTLAPSEVTGIAAVAGDDVVVLDDVSADSLGATGTDALRVAVAELGKGLLAIGGTSSYGAGDYLGSPLEELLPVTSEVTDPKRQSKLAQVFAVDTSGSMGACHCAEGSEGGNSGPRLDGGVRKTDIARDAVVRAVEEMSPDDLVGILGLSDGQTWHAPLAPVGNASAAKSGAAGLKPTNTTNLAPSLRVAADSLRDQTGAIRHIVLFTDGFTDTTLLARLADEAAELREQEGITVSVMGTGEGAAAQLATIAERGGGRYYRGRDLRELPDLLRQETKIVSRQLIVEGEALPEITSAAPIVAGLTSAPALGGYVATTERPTAQVHLRIGAERDPLLATWNVGLGKVAAWTSDSGLRWTSSWSGWSGSVEHWAAVIRSVAPAESGTVRLRADGTDGRIEASFRTAVPGGAEVTARVVRPDGTVTDVPLVRQADDTFQAPTQVPTTGTYAIGVTATVGGQVAATATGTTDASFSREYLAEGVDRDLLTAASRQTGGRGAIRATAAFERAGLPPGRRPIDLRPWLIGSALLAIPTFVALSRLRFASGPAAVRAVATDGLAGLSSALSSRRHRGTGPEVPRPPDDHPRDPGPTSATTAADHDPIRRGPPAASPDPARRTASAATPDAGPPEGGASIGSLLEAKRRRRDGA